MFLFLCFEFRLNIDSNVVSFLIQNQQQFSSSNRKRNATSSTKQFLSASYASSAVIHMKWWTFKTEKWSQANILFLQVIFHLKFKQLETLAAAPRTLTTRLNNVWQRRRIYNSFVVTGKSFNPQQEGTWVLKNRLLYED